MAMRGTAVTGSASHWGTNNKPGAWASTARPAAGPWYPGRLGSAPQEGSIPSAGLRAPNMAPSPPLSRAPALAGGRGRGRGGAGAVRSGEWGARRARGRARGWGRARGRARGAPEAPAAGAGARTRP